MFASIAFFLASILSFLSTFSEAILQKVLCEDPQGQHFWGPPGCNSNIHGRSNIPLRPACQGPDGPIYQAGGCSGRLGQTSESPTTQPCTLISTDSAGSTSYGCQGLSSTTYATGWLTTIICTPTVIHSAVSSSTGCIASYYSTSVPNHKVPPESSTRTKHSGSSSSSKVVSTHYIKPTLTCKAE